MKRSLIIVGVILAAFALAGGAFWGGMNVGQAQANSAAQNTRNFFASRGVDPNNATGAAGAGGGFFGGGGGGAGGQGGAGGAGGARGGQRGAVGTVTKVEGNTITMTDQQGRTVTVNLANNTPIVKTVLGTSSDIKAGTRILVAGARSGDNVSATQITIADMPSGVSNPFGGFGGRPTPATTPTK